ncbi:PD-(D/E)XK nuclease family protein [Lunatibacter salilacus]|uniref:PD-(D/E)XK nuclease family protein n=1 Tax=Lunatibacter salilacus TaxID=2483804 RepID=UPI00131E7662|nr:PD-(D/E)XK nuclease family protein [Lunatibacter salilacus]
MDSFLRETAQDLLDKRGQLRDMTIILPNRRAGLFFTRHLGQLIQEPAWMPAIKTIEDLFNEIAQLRPADSLTLIFELYQVYIKLHPSPEPFDRFYFWGELILKDFNDLDQFMVDASKLYHQLSEIKEIETDWSFLTEHQIALIQAFWRTFEGKESQHKDKFLKFWELLAPLYEAFQSSLKVAGLAYSGMIYRQVAESLSEMQPPEAKHIFVGFNAFTLTEKKLIKHFIASYNAEIYWDLDAYYVADPQQESGLFFREYLKDPVLGPTFPEELPQRISAEKIKIKTYATPLKVTQANLTGSILSQVGNFENLEETVVILPDEQLLFPLLNILPEGIKKVNVTMGYPIKNTPIYTFLESVLELQRYIKIEEGVVLFYHKPVVDLLSSVYLRRENPALSLEISGKIQATNQVYVTKETFQGGGKLFSLVFNNYFSGSLLPGLMELIQDLAEHSDMDGLDRSYLFQCYKQLNRLNDLLLNRSEITISLEFVIRIFRQIFREVKLPFEGEPLEGLQIMGVLESRNLDFRRVIICHMNEGSFPPSASLNSMVPFNLRRAFGLPVQEQNDAIYGYTFYRLLHRAEEVHLIYTTAADQGRAGERSRYLYQLLEELGLQREVMKDEVVFVPVDIKSGEMITIQKNPAILELMKRYLVNETGSGTVAISPSALSIWLDCRLKFYFKYIAELAEEEAVSEEVDPAVFGNLVHGALENLYLGFIARKKRIELIPGDFPSLKDFIFPAIEKAIRKQYFLSEDDQLKLTGHLTIARDVLQKYLLQILEVDEMSAPFEIISLEAEKKYKAQFPIQTPFGSQIVLLGGIIDRVDKREGVIRLMDYKSGKDSKQFPSIASLFDRENKNRNKAAMQTLFYGLLYHYNFPENKLPLKPALLNLRDIFASDFSPYLEIKEPRGKPIVVENYLDYKEAFETHLRELLGELFGQDIPFDQTEDLTKCAYCPYSEICGR